ncbi:MAG: response regulator transcription factor [Lentimicrobiaceae bacterium]|jgi:DNA-binding NarL/FixJ family response regulator|nr:response regulator transcription factor [Lentimicrobiaceae bacterium]
MEKIKIILVDDHQIVRDGIKALLTGVPDLEVIGEASDAVELAELLKYKKPDILLLDISLPGMSGIEITRNLVLEHPEIKVLILSMYTNEDFIFNAIKTGAKGYLPKNTSQKEIIDAINAVYRGEEYFSESISNIILKSYIKKVKTGDEPEEITQAVLSKRELEILKHFAEGYSNQQIADKLFISIRTVESHKNHIMQKLKLNTTVDLIKFAIKNKIIEL